jgi:FAD synthetase
LHLLRLVVSRRRQRLAAAAAPAADPELDGLCLAYFVEKDPFPEVARFIEETKAQYGLTVVNITTNFKDGMEWLVSARGLQAIFMGTRESDPGTAGMELSAPSSAGWPQFVRLNPILRWTYTDVWEFNRSLGLAYCSLYDAGYTSLGSTANTAPNPALLDAATGTYAPAYALADGALERAGRGRDAVLAAEAAAAARRAPPPSAAPLDGQA